MARTERWSLLSDPKWQGIGAIAAIVAIIVVLYSGSSPNGPTSAKPATTRDSTTIRATTPPTTHVPTTQGASERDPPEDDVYVLTESSQDFFEGDLAVSITDTNYDDAGDLILTRVVLLAAGEGACRFSAIKIGDDPGIAAGDWVYRVMIRGMSLSGADLAASRRAAPASRTKRCLPVTS